MLLLAALEVTKQEDKLYDATPEEFSDFTTVNVCDECYEDTARDLEADGYHLDL